MLAGAPAVPAVRELYTESICLIDLMNTKNSSCSIVLKQLSWEVKLQHASVCSLKSEVLNLKTFFHLSKDIKTLECHKVEKLT